MCREILFFSQTILQISLLRRLHGPCGAGRGLRPRSRAVGATPFPRCLYKPITYNSSKTFFILFLTSNKTVSKIKPAEKNKYSFKSMVKTLLCIGLLRRPGAIRRRFAYGRSPVICLAVFSANPLFKLIKNWFQCGVSLFVFIVY